MRAAALAAALLLLAGCPRTGAKPPAPDDEPPAEPAPVEIDWPDAGVPTR